MKTKEKTSIEECFGARKYSDDLVDLIRKRIIGLEMIIKEKTAALESAPEGSLRVNQRKTNTEYFLRTDPKDTNGTYMKKESFELARMIAQRDYDIKVLRNAKQEYKLADKYARFLSQNQIIGIYDDLIEGRRSLINPIRISDEEYIAQWKSLSYEPMGFGSDAAEYYSDNGIRVRSKSEIIIANMLEKYGIPYKYEYPVTLEGLGTVRPDFTCLNVNRRKEIVWEHFGMMDQEDYANKNVVKIKAYEENGFMLGENLIMTFETIYHPINSNVIKRMITKYLVE